VHRRTRIETVRRVGDRWEVDDASGVTRGPFDALLLNPPAPQTADLLRSAEWDSPVREALVDAVGDVAYRTVWTAVLHYPFPLDVPYYGLVNTDKARAVGWLSRDECKSGHVPDGETLLIVQANHEWSVEHYDADPAENVAMLAEHAADIVGDDRLADPAWTDYQGGGTRSRRRASIAARSTRPVKRGCTLLGDWVAGEARVHAALANGLDVGERVADGV